MYQSFISLEEARRNPLRIHDPWSYRVAYEEQFIPLTIAEAFPLAPHFPVVWKRDETGRHQLVVFRGFARPGDSLPGGVRNTADAMPLLLQAYPFRFRNERAGLMEIGLDRVSPARTRDVGAPLFAQGGDFTAGAELKRLALGRFAADMRLTGEVTELLADIGVLQTIALPVALAERFNVPELFHLGPSGDERNLLNVMLSQFGNRIATFVTGHKLSLYRMGPLIAQASSPATRDSKHG